MGARGITQVSRYQQVSGEGTPVPGRDGGGGGAGGGRTDPP